MATYTYANMVTLADSMCAGISTSGIDVTAIDFIDAMFWRYYLWRWTTASLTPVSLTSSSDGVQDFSLSNTDVLRLISMRIARTDLSPVQNKDLMVMKWLEPELVMKISFPNFSSCAHYQIADASKIRFPAALSIPSGQTLSIRGEYQKVRTKLTATSSSVVFPEDYANVFAEGLIWYYYRFTRDKRQGDMEIVDHRAVYTGQLGIFMDAMQNAAETEDWGKGETRFPDQPIGAENSFPINTIFGP